MKERLIIAALAFMSAGVICVSYAAASASPSQDPTGQELYEANCRKCHGVRGVPPKTMKAKYPKIATFDMEFFTKHTDDSVVTVLANGKGDDMKSFKAKLSHDEMVQVAAYIRSLGTR